MTEPIAVFLRGINVGGIQIKMDALKAAFEAMGFSDVQTLLASGNVVLTPPQDESRVALKAHIEALLSERFGYEAYVLLRDAEQIGALMETARTISVPADHHLYVLLCGDAGLPAEMESLFHTLPRLASEQFIALPEDAFWIVPKGETLGSDFGSKVLGSRKFKSRLTSRNFNTLEKVHRRMQEQNEAGR